MRLEQVMADVENIIDVIPNESKDTLRARVTNIVTNYAQDSHNTQPSSLTLSYNKTKQFLKSHPEIYILQSNKSGCIVAKNKDDYIQKTKPQLNDKSTYLKLNRDPTTTTKTAHNNLIKSFKTRHI